MLHMAALPSMIVASGYAEDREIADRPGEIVDSPVSEDLRAIGSLMRQSCRRIKVRLLCLMHLIQFNCQRASRLL